MEATYRQGVERRRNMRRTSEGWSGERRRMVQLLISLGLFLLVFIGRGAFPGFAENLSSLLAADIDFKSTLQQFEADIAADERILVALRRLAAASIGKEPLAEPSPEPEPSESPADGIEIVLLSDTEQHGLSYFREYGLRTYLEQPQGMEDEDGEPEAQIVTATAQAYNSAGEVLPSNVSYEYYEFGLTETMCPVNGTATSGFDYRISPITGKREFHLALDIAAETGTEIRAFADGVVRYIGESDDFGLYFMIDHDNGVSTFYAHCSRLMVHKGDAVSCGQVVALVGETGKTTGPHLHFTVEKDGIRLNPAYYVDPS